MKCGLVLEGGGAKGAYQIGALKALFERGYKFDAVCGTSIGSINAAMVAQGDFDKLYKMWTEISYDDLFDIDKETLERIIKLDVRKDTLKYVSDILKKTLKEKGIDTSRIRKLIEDNIDEDKLRNSKVKFGLVTYCLSDMSPKQVFIDDIPKGKVVDYIMASSNLPVFKRACIDEKHYLDGGVYDNCPVRMLEERGYEQVYAVRAFKVNRIRGYRGILKRGNTKIYKIQPKKRLPSILDFRRETLDYQLNLGYYDTIKNIDKLDGLDYYIKNDISDDIYDRIIDISIGEIIDIADRLDIGYKAGENIKVVYIEKILPYLVSKTEFKAAINNKDIFYAFLEYILKRKDVQRYQIYSLSELLEKYIIQDTSKSGKIQETLIKILQYTINR